MSRAPDSDRLRELIPRALVGAELSVPQLAERFDCPQDAVRRAVADLVRAGRVECKDHDGQHRTYGLA